MFNSFLYIKVFLADIQHSFLTPLLFKYVIQLHIVYLNQESSNWNKTQTYIETHIAQTHVITKHKASNTN